MIKTKQLTKVDDILNLLHFKPDNPVRPENYRHLMYSYELPKEVICNYQKDNGVICGRPHKKGAIVMLKDGSLSNVGCCCANNYFSDGTECLSKHYQLLENQIRLERKHQGLINLLDKKETNIPLINSLLDKIKGQRQRVRAFAESIGTEVTDQLQRRAKESRPQVYVEAATFRHWVDHNGNKGTEKSSVPFRIGSIKNIDIFNPAYAQNLSVDLLKAKNAYDFGEALLEGDIRKKDVFEQTIATLNAIPGLERKATIYIAQVDGFFDAEKHPLLYVVRETAQRYKIARALLNLAGKPVGKDKAKVWVREQDEVIKEAAKCDSFTFIA